MYKMVDAPGSRFIDAFERLARRAGSGGWFNINGMRMSHDDLSELHDRGWTVERAAEGWFKASRR